MSFVVTSKLTSSQLGKVLSAHVIAELMVTGRYHLHGFGVFTVVRRKARSVRAFNGRSIVEIPAMNTIHFHPSTSLHEDCATLTPYKKRAVKPKEP